MKNMYFASQYKFKYKLMLSITMLICFLSISSYAQFFSSSFKSQKRNSDVPTVITSDSMDLDIGRNVAVFTGNVQVNDVQMKIFCHKMIINFAGGEKKDGKMSTNKSVKNIICLKDVVIIRKVNGEDAKGGEQKAIAEKAIYDVKAGKITLMDKAELRRGPDSLTGEVIIFWLDSERLSVPEKPTLKIRSKPNRGK